MQFNHHFATIWFIFTPCCESWSFLSMSSYLCCSDRSARKSSSVFLTKSKLSFSLSGSPELTRAYLRVLKHLRTLKVILIWEHAHQTSGHQKVCSSKACSSADRIREHAHQVLQSEPPNTLSCYSWLKENYHAGCTGVWHFIIYYVLPFAHPHVPEQALSIRSNIS